MSAGSLDMRTVLGFVVGLVLLLLVTLVTGPLLAVLGRSRPGGDIQG